MGHVEESPIACRREEKRRRKQEKREEGEKMGVQKFFYPTPSLDWLPCNCIVWLGLSPRFFPKSFPPSHSNSPTHLHQASNLYFYNITQRSQTTSFVTKPFSQLHSFQKDLVYVMTKLSSMQQFYVFQCK